MDPSLLLEWLLYLGGSLSQNLLSSVEIHHFLKRWIGWALTRKLLLLQRCQVGIPELSTSYQVLMISSEPGVLRWLRTKWFGAWSMPRYNFILWLAVLGRLKTKDRFCLASIDASCVLCCQEDETHSHLFFSCAVFKPLGENQVLVAYL